MYQLLSAKRSNISKILFVTASFLCGSTYSWSQIPTDNLVAFYPFDSNANDESGNNNNASIISAVLTEDRFSQPNSAYMFNGTDEFIEFPDTDNLSISNTSELSISVWMRCDTLNFPASQSSGYVHWMGKGVSGQHEWTFRIYNLDSDRPNRTSCYAFNLGGGLGAGSYEEENISQGDWIHFVATYDYPENRIQLYKNGTLRDTDLFSDYSIIPGNGTAPLRIGTRDFNSFFKGAIDDIRIYKRILDTAEVLSLYNEDFQNASNPSVFNTIDNFSVYPNPANDNISVTISSLSQKKDYLIKLLNSKGQLVYTEKVYDNNLSINTNTFSGKGLHRIILLGHNGELIASKNLLISN